MGDIQLPSYETAPEEMKRKIRELEDEISGTAADLADKLEEDQNWLDTIDDRRIECEERVAAVKAEMAELDKLQVALADIAT